MPRRSPFACSAPPNRARQVLETARDTATDRPNSCARGGRARLQLFPPSNLFLLSQGVINDKSMVLGSQAFKIWQPTICPVSWGVQTGDRHSPRGTAGGAQNCVPTLN